MKAEKEQLERRNFLRNCAAGAAGLLVAGVGAKSFFKDGQAVENVWQIDPEKCVQCGRCETHCVLSPSAVKCMHAFEMCGYCQLCFGYFRPEAASLDSAGENQMCPTGAIKRRFVEDPYYEYTIDEDLCVGCGKCVKSCAAFGNASLYLQIRQDLCINCNECAIARACPVNAIQRIDPENPYLHKGNRENKTR